MHFQSTSEEETLAIAGKILSKYTRSLEKGAVVFAVTGEMGSGKTRFAKGIAQELGVDGVVASPTYVLTREYDGVFGRLIHIDCWRSQGITAEELELEQYFVPNTVLVIEWPEPLLEYLRARQDIVLVELSITGDGETREITTKS